MERSRQIDRQRRRSEWLFGAAVGLSGDLAIVGASRQNNATGAAYIFEMVDSSWTEAAKLTASDALAGELFGGAVDAMDDEDTVRAYKSLAQVERAFRSLKTVDLQIRPLFHWLAPRVRAHVFLHAGLSCRVAHAPKAGPDALRRC